MIRSHLSVLLALAACALIGAGAVISQDPPRSGEGAPSEPPATTFHALSIYIDSHDASLAAWQVSLSAPKPVKIVGIESADFAAQPPQYDAAALQGNRIVLAQFSLDDKASLPRGELCVARLHLHVTGELNVQDIQAELVAAADFEGERIAAGIWISQELPDHDELK